ncbi:thioesterase II family protein [Vibrio hepatarius]|uniref:thioesterase II family protein n=1 Tax=Vibrio hepatarius TaxID=171383 RepID=UPI001C0823D2|nr:thioesterase domain-containing protein [Vibrio hepatarius]MBU2898686.1 thioesterase [Vibrio hepatarius]
MITNNFKLLCQKGTNVEEIWVLCPFAGGSNSAFTSWALLDEHDLPNNTHIFLATYPGRDQRMKEPPLNSIEAIAFDLFQNLMSWNSSYTDRQKIPRLRLCGHSMGAQIAFEVARRFEVEFSANTPVSHLVLSGCHAPHLESRRMLSHLNDEKFVEQLIEIGSGSPVLKEHPELLSLFLPMLRADFYATEAYRQQWDSRSTLTHTHSSLLYGQQDPEAWCSEVSAWQKWFSSREEASIGYLPGDHFYITNHPALFIKSVIEHAASPNRELGVYNHG